MKLAVVGSRTFNDYRLLKEQLDEIHAVTPISTIVSGGAKGADKLAEKWAHQNNVETLIFEPDWEKFGRSAGYLRNKDIVLNSNRLIAFWDGVSKGTLHSINIADHHQIPYTVVNFKDGGI